MAQQTHRSDPNLLSRRTLEKDHRGLVEFLRPGMAVLDVGCGTGSITAGIAGVVGPEGHAVGLDRDESLLAIAASEFGRIANLSFVCRDAESMEYDSRFDVVTAARSVQWMATPKEAVARMARAVKPGGAVVIVDYNHAGHRWTPALPKEFMLLYRAFLLWREANGWDNRIADSLPGMMRAAGLRDVCSVASDEGGVRGDAGFAGVSAIWRVIIGEIGSKLVESRLLTERQNECARLSYEEYVAGQCELQTLSMGTVWGRRG